jgi:hypothetical protein
MLEQPASSNSIAEAGNLPFVMEVRPFVEQPSLVMTASSFSRQR